LGSNLEDRNDCGFAAAGDKFNTDPNIAAALANNDGHVQNHALLAGSQAINAANNSYCPANDTRGWLFLRNDGACDIGSFEFGIVETKLNNKLYMPTVLR
jgi:hypothetical protein